MDDTVIDVNVLVSAAISPNGNPYRILELWHAGRFDVVTSDHIITQVTIKLQADRIARRYHLTVSAIRAFTGPLRTDARKVNVSPSDLLPVTGDPEDDTVLAAARLGRAKYLVTGDTRLQAIGTYEGVTIVSPRRFLEMLDG
jgi:putative PIN family toxin of toxin-antitoxin system